MSVSEYATAYAEYVEHPQHVAPPVAPAELDETTAGYVRRLVADGHRAAVARGRRDEATANLHRETVSKLRSLVKPLSADELFGIGYRAGV